MIKELLYKWFGIEPLPCKTCEVLRHELEVVRREKELLLDKLINKPEPEVQKPADPVTFEPIMPRAIPWRVRQQMLEAEDREAAKKLREKQIEMSESVQTLEKELGVNNG